MLHHQQHTQKRTEQEDEDGKLQIENEYHKTAINSRLMEKEQKNTMEILMHL